MAWNTRRNRRPRRAQPVGPRFWPERKPSLAVRLRPFLLLLVLVALWPMADPRILPPVGPLAGEPEMVDRRFTLCGLGRGFACVIDGDTFRLGDRRIRIADINAPELAEPECEAERMLARRSQRELLALLNEGGFVMVANRLDDRDRYGRELRHLERDGQSIGDQLIDRGLAHPYRGALEPGWC